MKTVHLLASDNNSGVHPKIMEAIIKANTGDVFSYGEDEYTKRAIEKFRHIFGNYIDVFFTLNGTGSNVTGISTVLQGFNAIISAETAHINKDECGAVERYSGCKIITIPSKDGKIRVENIEDKLNDLGIEHHSQPRLVSISQPTELGTVYSIDELMQISKFVHDNNMFLHVDGARICNAAVYLKKGLKEITINVGVDILSFGGTKNGMMLGEAVVFLNKELGRDFKYIRKQANQLASKMRFISAQFEALLTDDLWYENALHANNMIKLLEENIKNIKEVKITQKVQSNAIFAVLPKDIIKKLQDKTFFYIWNEEKGEVRWIASFNTTKETIIDFVKELKYLISYMK